MDEQTKALVTIECPHCQSENADLELVVVDPELPIRVACRECGEPIWVKILEVKEDGTARLQIGKAIKPADITKLLEENGGKCPACGREIKGSQERTYLLDDSVHVVRQGKALSPNGIAVVLQRLCSEDVIPARFIYRETIKETGALRVKLRWNDLEAADRGLKIWETLIPEEVTDGNE